MGQQQRRLRVGSTLSSAIRILALGLPLWPLRTGGAQVAPPSQSSPGQTTSGYPRLGVEPNEPNPLGPANAARLAKMREDERHKRLLADTEKLVALTGELKADVEKASKNELSLDVVRKAAEIEKLAHDVKERMKS